MLAVGLPALLAAGCRREAPAPRHDVALLDGHHAPDVLTESRLLEPPKSTAGNRFLRGWGFFRKNGEMWLTPRDEARLEIVQLAARPRRLMLLADVREAPPDASVRVSVGGREVADVPLASPLEIPLPADLPLGRTAVDLEFPAAEVAVRQAGFRQPLPAGEVRFEEGAIVQSGHSLVDVVRRIPPGSRLVGRFVPPSGASAEQRFAVLVDDGGTARPVFEWRGDLWSRWRGDRELDLPLPPDGGLVRIRLAAEHPGPAARWQDLHLRAPGPSPAAVPSTPPPAPRLVVLYVLDALRADHLGHLGGSEGISPTLDRLAAEGVTFTRHLSVAPNTLPSTKALFTGQAYVHQGGWKMKADGPETLAQALAAAGYRTGVFSGNGHLGPAFGTLRGFEHDGREWVYDPAPGISQPYNDNAERVQRAAVRWLDELAPGERAFAYLHSLNPHNPYLPPRPLERRWAQVEGSRIDGRTETLLSIQRFRIRPSEPDMERVRGLYAGGVAYNDAQIEHLVAELEERYEPGEVLLIVTSDHGEELFEHDGLLHGYTLYDEQLRIPLIFWWPGRLEPARIDVPTDNLDLHETLRALVAAPPSGRGPGRSLWPLLTAGDSGWDKDLHFAAASSVKGGIFMARSDHHKLIWAPRTGGGWGQGEGRGRSRDPEYFFDLESDPGETVNRVGDGSLEEAWLRSRLLAWIERGKAVEAGVTEEAAELDDETRANLRALGYLD